MTPKNAARAAGEMFFIGNVCKKHKELKGRRRTASGGCPSCILERVNRRRKKMGSKAWNRRRRKLYAAIKAGKHVPRKYRKANEKATGTIARADG
jgi:hypothetical protein